MVGEGSWRYLWSIKALLRDFEMVSRLRVNYKSKLFGLNLKKNFT